MLLCKTVLGWHWTHISSLRLCLTPKFCRKGKHWTSLRLWTAWCMWHGSALWYNVMASLWMGPWGHFSTSRAPAVTVDVLWALVLATPAFNNAELPAHRCLPIDAYPSFLFCPFSVCSHWVTFPQLIGGASWQRMFPAGSVGKKPQQCHLWSHCTGGTGTVSPSPWGSVLCSGPPNPPLLASRGCDWGFPTRGQFYHACTPEGAEPTLHSF